jgi:hypothetical protein
MKKLGNRTSQHRKLALRSEAVASLSPPRLHQVVGGNTPIDGGGGNTYFYPCDIRSFVEASCVAAG